MPVSLLGRRRRSPSRSKRVGSALGHFSPPASSGSSSPFVFDDLLDDTSPRMSKSFTSLNAAGKDNAAEEPEDRTIHEKRLLKEWDEMISHLSKTLDI
ncbi:unnamed protein product [Heligmosomoides polygyrus]|uniref:Uncharacterized protein n=1 Tax=Heligmosomoides polygyrus TaxID=6339 RepID=A0A3P7XWP8_HELPZ|nr:unnamed protein product [Heligmosomoides polygyrus]